MSSSVLDEDIPYNVLFPSKYLVPVEPCLLPIILLCVMVIHMLLNWSQSVWSVSFLGILSSKKEYRCSSSTHNHYLMFSDATFLDSTLIFSLIFCVWELREEDDFLIYIVKKLSRPPFLLFLLLQHQLVLLLFMFILRDWRFFTQTPISFFDRRSSRYHYTWLP